MTKLASSRMLVGVPLLLALVITLVAVAWLQSAAPLYASHGTIRVAGIGGNFGTRAADTICAEGDVDCVITRINSASVFNAMTPTQLRDSYDVLLITWGTSRLFDLDWDSRLQPYMTLGGGVIWEDPNNLDDISAIITTGGGSSWPPDITATVPGLTDGVVGGSASSFANNHLVFSAWDPGLSPFMTGSGGNGVLGLWGHVGTGGCIVLQGPDADFHANRTGSYFVEQYELLANEIIFVSHTCTPSTPPNRPPTANANGPYYVNEGGSAVLSGAGHDPDGDPLTYSWDLDNNGSFETAGQNPTFSAAGLDGPDDRTATLQVCDPSNACDTDSATITIVNVAPVASVTNDGISEAGTASLTITFSDVGAPDTHTVVVDWDEGMVDFPGVVASPFDIDHVYGDDGTYDVTVTVTDDDGGVTTGTGMVAVGNL
ncbi:MAG: PKD domain-containing protein, partial [SAR202 cluster bacterium]|nr:PKD domain-containing protein [SAR202 cluster bacterium]